MKAPMKSLRTPRWRQVWPKLLRGGMGLYERAAHRETPLAWVGNLLAAYASNEPLGCPVGYTNCRG